MSLKDIKKRKKTPRLNKRIYDTKYIGKEPEFDEDYVPSQLDLAKTYSWYNYVYNAKEGFDFLIDYLKEVEDDRVIHAVKIRDALFPRTLFWISRLLHRGIDLSDQEIVWFNENLDYTIARYKEESEEKVDRRSEINVHDAMKEKLNEIIGDIEQFIDEDELVSLYEYLKVNEIPPTYGPRIAEHYQPILEELQEVITGKADKQLKEGYSVYTKDQLSDMEDIYIMIVNDSIAYAENKKKTRKQRQPKPQSVDKKLKHFHYLKEDDTIKAVSVDPGDIIGASEVWMLNTKYGELKVLRAEEGLTLDIKGTSILNVDIDNSNAQKVGKRSEEKIKEVSSAGKRALKKCFDDLTTKPYEPSIRSSRETIIVRVVK